MEGREHGTTIRKIEWGLQQSGNFAVSIGGPCRSAKKIYKVSEIIEDKNTFIDYGKFEYLVFASEDGTKKNQFLWQRYLRAPDKIEYFATDELQDTLL